MPGQPRLVKNKRFLNIQMTKDQFEIKGTVLFPATSAQVAMCMPSSHKAPRTHLSSVSKLLYMKNYTFSYIYKLCGLIMG